MPFRRNSVLRSSWGQQHKPTNWLRGICGMDRGNCPAHRIANQFKPLIQIERC
jgi:hypothetical protein